MAVGLQRARVVMLSRSRMCSSVCYIRHVSCPSFAARDRRWSVGLAALSVHRRGRGGLDVHWRGVAGFRFALLWFEGLESPKHRDCVWEEDL